MSWYKKKRAASGSMCKSYVRLCRRDANEKYAETTTITNGLECIVVLSETEQLNHQLHSPQSTTYTLETWNLVAPIAHRTYDIWLLNRFYVRPYTSSTLLIAHSNSFILHNRHEASSGRRGRKRMQYVCSMHITIQNKCQVMLFDSKIFVVFYCCPCYYIFY